MGDTIDDPRQIDLVEMLEDQKLRELARKCARITTVVEEEYETTPVVCANSERNPPGISS